MANPLRVKRGTRAQITAAMGASGIAVGEPYLVTDEARIAIGTSTTSVSDMAKKSEVDSKANATHTHAQSDITNLVSDLALKAPLASPALTGVPTAPTATGGTNTTQIATTAFVATGLATKAASVHTHAISDITSLQSTLDGKASSVHTHAISDVTNLQSSLDAKAPLASPSFTGVPAAPTATAGTNTTQVATTAFVATGLATKANTSHTHAISDTTGLQTALDGKVGTTGNETIAGTKTFSSNIVSSVGSATTFTAYLLLQPTDWGTGKPRLAFDKSATANQWDIGLWDGVNNAGTLNFNASILTKQGSTIWHAGNDGAGSGLDADLLDGVQGSSYALLASPALTGTPTAPTATAGTNTTQIATTAFVTGGLGTKVGTTGSETIAGTKTFTSIVIASINTATTQTEYYRAIPTDYGVGKPYFTIQKTATATLWNLGLWDGVNNAGTINVSATGFTLNGVSIATTASPALTGTPTAPTAAQGSNDTTIASTAFVKNNFVNNYATQTIAGSKTFSSSVTVLGSLVLSPAATASIEIGRIDGNASTPFIDFHSGATATDYDARIIASGGSGSSGGATLTVNAASFQWNGTTIATEPYAAGFAVPAGAVIAFAMSSAPTGYLKANGAAVSRTTYSVLYNAIGTTFGTGDGSTTFNLPDLRGEFVRGWDDARGIDTSRTLGSFQDHAVGEHQHRFFYGTATNTAGGGALDRVSAMSGANSRDTNSIITGNTATETRPRNVALLYCIKY